MYDIGLLSICHIPPPHKCVTPLIALHLCLTFISCSKKSHSEHLSPLWANHVVAATHTSIESCLPLAMSLSSHACDHWLYVVDFVSPNWVTVIGCEAAPRRLLFASNWLLVGSRIVGMNVMSRASGNAAYRVTRHKASGKKAAAAAAARCCCCRRCYCCHCH